MPAQSWLKSAIALLSLSLLNGVQAQNCSNTQSLTGFPPCDALIAAGLTNAVYMPDSPRFGNLLNGSWALNTRKAPWCYVLPASTEEISKIIIALRFAGNGAGDWHIAIRSGGHGSDSSNNIEYGVTIDLQQLNTTTYNPAANTASLSTGARWQSVYTTLQKHNVSVTGGREGIVGVGGFMLGGGNSFYTAKNGFSCDNVVNYEVVLSSGQITNANASHNTDLWKALRGGGSNFGIVTRFDVEAFPAKNVTFELRTIGSQHLDNLIDAFVDFTNATPKMNASIQDNTILSVVTYQPTAGGIIGTLLEVNTANDESTHAFDALNAVPTLAPSTKKSLTLADAANNTQIQAASRNAGSYLTLANDPKIMKFCIEEHAALVKVLNTTLGPNAFSTAMEFQAIPTFVSDISVSKGGNMLGLERSPRSKIFFVFGIILVDTSKNAQLYPWVNQQVNAVVQRIDAHAKAIGSSEEFVYLNYAHANQDPIGSYGKANVAFIRNVAKKYDPEGFFQQRVPGGFKISRV